MLTCPRVVVAIIIIIIIIINIIIIIFIFINGIHNKILDCDWYSARLFLTLSARDHVGVQLQVSDLNFL